MIRYGVFVTLVVLAGVSLVLGRECCQTGYDEYMWCDDYCCGSLSLYHYCCSSYSRKIAYNSAEDSDCEAWLTAHVWAIVLIVLGCIAVVVGCIVCCVCCIKGCCTDSRPGAVVVAPAQQGPGMFMVNNSTTQQSQMQQPMQYGYGQPGPSSTGVHPPPYFGPGAEKAGGPMQ